MVGSGLGGGLVRGECFMEGRFRLLMNVRYRPKAAGRASSFLPIL